MSSREILTLQFGHYANYVGSHWWNIQELSFDYNGIQSSQVDHDVLFREGLTSKGQVTFTPRLLLVDLKGSLKSLPKEGDLYENTLPECSITWDDNKLEIQKEEKVPKNEFQTDIENSTTFFDVPHKKYKLEESVRVWSDYLYSRFHPRSVNIINQYQHASNETPFDTFSVGTELWKSEFFQEDFNDKMRNYIEECDHFQGFHILTDCTNGFSGLSSSCLENIRDEYDRKSVLVCPTIPSFFPDNEFETDIEQVQSIMSDSTRVINLALCFNQFREFSNMFTPLCTGKDGWRQPGEPRKFYHTNYNHKLAYHSSAILASALETVTMKYRLKSSSFSLMDICADLTANGRKVVATSVCHPFSFNCDIDFIDCLDRWEGPLYQSISPRCTIGTNRVMQHLTILGVPEYRLKKSHNKAGKQKDMPAYNYNTAKEMLEYYLACTTYATASNVTAVEKPLQVKTPYPDIFDQHVGQNGNIYVDPRPDDIKVQSIPILAGFHCGAEIGEMLESLHSEAGKLKIARFHQFSVDTDEYKECLNDILTLKEQYEDSYLI